MNKDAPFPRLDANGSIPVGLASRMRAARATDWHKRKEPDYWFTSVSKNLEKNLDFRDVATFILAISCFRDWLESPERREQYKLASEQSHHLPKGGAFIRQIVAPTVHLYSTRGGQQLEALAALGFALRSSREKHSLRLWRPFERAICREGLGRPESVWRNEQAVSGEVDAYFKNIRSRLNTAKERLGDEVAMKEQARRVFSALRSAAFEN